MNPLKALREHGQSVWLDFLSRRFVTDGGLKRLIVEDGLAGVTSNPSIFKKAIADTGDYDDALKDALGKGDEDVMTLYERLAIADIKSAADVLRPVHEETSGADGFVSLEVSPYSAFDTDATIQEARRLWKAVARPNVMIKVPATKAGIPAIRALIGEGININITLLFSRAVYAEVVEAYLSGLEDFIAKGGNPRGLSSVASFFVSRIDTLTDKRIDERLQQMPSDAGAAALSCLRGKIAIANAKLAYRDFLSFFTGPRWEKMNQAGARVQRLLWASTSTKNPAYRDVLYVEELIGPNTINTLPLETLSAFRDHGKVAPTLDKNIGAAETMLATLIAHGISLDDITTELTRQGVQLFADSFDDLLAALAKKVALWLPSPLDRQRPVLPDDLQADVQGELEGWRREGKVRRLWRRDASLWTGAGEADWLGWLDVVRAEQESLDRLESLAKQVQAEGFTHIVLIGMGGSSLGVEVLAKVFGRQSGFAQILVLDSTDPSQIKSVEQTIDIARTLFVVSSKSGTTLEPNILMEYFLARAGEVMPPPEAASHFIAITDPSSKLAEFARTTKFRACFAGEPSIGGRYSVLSDFGMVPAALMGLDVARCLASAKAMVRACGMHVPPAENPGVVLGAVLGAAARRGCDKVTIIASPAIAAMGAWLEQLLAESTGKNGKGFIPVDAEPLGPPEVYGSDRLFLYLRLENAADAAQDQRIAALEAAGKPVVRIDIYSRFEIGQEFFRFEIATAVAGAILRLNPFDQPDVEASKIKTRELMAAFERDGRLPIGPPLLQDEGISVFADSSNAQVLKQAGDGMSLVGSLKAHLSRLHPGDYCALLAYIAENESHVRALTDIRVMIRDARRIATCVGFGPRFLHSTGQAYKGGPNSGVFLQITADPAVAVPVPGRGYDFGAVIAAQAAGDLAVLNERGRRALRVHLAGDVQSGLARLKNAVERALA